MLGLIKFLSAIFSILFASVAHLIFSFLLPYPFSTINVLIILIVISILVTESGTVVWLSFFSYFIIELYSQMTPFGVVLLAGTLSTLLAFWLYKHIITNRSWYSSLALIAVTLFFYRLIYFSGLLFLISLRVVQSPDWFGVFVFFGWELLLTSVVMAILFLILRFFLKPLKKAVISRHLIFRF